MKKLGHQLLPPIAAFSNRLDIKTEHIDLS